MPNLGCCATKNCQNLCSGLRYYDKKILSQYILRSVGKCMLCSCQNASSSTIFGGSCDCGPIHKTQIRNTSVLFVKAHNVAKRVYSTYAYARHEDSGYKSIKLKAHSFVIYIYIYIYMFYY
jgi:hypothetical protein